MTVPDNPGYRQSPNADSVGCDHPLDAIMWNEWNRVTQCHRCGKVFDHTPMPSGDAMRYIYRPLTSRSEP